MKTEHCLTELQRYYALWRECNYIYGEWAKSHGLSLNTLMILYSFCEEPDGCTQKQISQKWMIPKQTVNAVLKEFEEQNYLKLIPLPSDKRNKQIHLTPEGRAFAREIIGQLREKELYVTEQMGAEHMKCMNDALFTFIELFRGDQEKSHE